MKERVLSLSCDGSGMIKFRSVSIGRFYGNFQQDQLEWDWWKFIYHRKQSGIHGKISAGVVEWMINSRPDLLELAKKAGALV